MRVKTTGWFLCLLAVFALATSAGAQDFRGRINGTVTDNTGAVLPGVTVTVTSPALIQPQVQVSGAEGDYRFLALPPGVYSVAFQADGNQSFKARTVPEPSTLLLLSGALLGLAVARRKGSAKA